MFAFPRDEFTHNRGKGTDGSPTLSSLLSVHTRNVRVQNMLKQDINIEPRKNVIPHASGSARKVYTCPEVGMGKQDGEEERRFELGF
jgi:hypothetical protein